MRRWPLILASALWVGLSVPGLVMPVTTGRLRLPGGYAVEIWESMLVITPPRTVATSIPIAFICWGLSLLMLLIWVLASRRPASRRPGFEIHSPNPGAQPPASRSSNSSSRAS